jgi:Asp-tRNA(Asn)/Glu-tRNA(Gln) amidotransferase A subunit family amidase
MRPLHELTAASAVDLLRRGEVTAEGLVRSCLDRIEAVEPRVLAFEAIDPDLALRAARRADEAGRPGPLHGLPLGVKDIIDTADLPTARGSPIFAGRRPPADAECVAALRRAGGIVLGKTVTTEFAFYFPGKTRNPHDPGRTPGGSSSGSAAAVAAGMVPAALGTQTAGSLIRPGAYCGVVALKPTHGLLPLGGVSPFAPSLDTLGVLARSADDLPVLLAGLGAPVPTVPLPARLRVGLCRTEAWDMTLPASREAVARAAAAFTAAGFEVGEVEEPFEGLSEAQRTVMAAEAVASLGPLRAEHEGRMSPQVLALLETGDRVTREALSAARARAAEGRRRLPAIFGRFDVLLGASTQGEAPPGLGATGDPALNRIWTLLGVPCVQLPAGQGPEGMPVGIQLVGPRGGEAALCAAAALAERALGADARSPTPA